MPYARLYILVIVDGEWHRFESDINIRQHKFFNDFLNEQVRGVQHTFKWLYLGAMELLAHQNRRLLFRQQHIRQAALHTRCGY